MGQVNTFPYAQGFESAFNVGTNIEFITNWTGNAVSTSSRIFQGTNARTGTGSLNIIPTSTFSGEVFIALDLTGVNNPKITFYAYSKQNGSGSSTRPVLLNLSTSIDGGNTFLDDIDIGDETTFPNNNTTAYTQYEYELPVSASGESDVIVRLFASRGDGGGSAAELVMDDFSIEEQTLPLAISTVSATDANTVEVTFNQEVDQTTAETVGNYTIDNGITISSVSKSASNVVTLITSPLSNNNYQLTVNDVEDAATNTPSVNLQDNFTFISPLSIEGITVQNKNTLLLDFNLDLDQSSAEIIGNYTVNNSIGNPTSANRSTTNNDQVTLVFGTDLEDNTYTLTVNNVTDESTLAVASSLTDNFSYLPLALESVTVTSSTTIELEFNQNLETTSAETEANYTINFGRENPTSAVQSGADASIITLTVSQAFVNNTYEVTINNLTNTSGNAEANSLTADAQYEVATATRQIVINELFADPSGSDEPNPLVLPNESSQEFVELFNTTAEAIDLTGFQLSGGTIESFVLDPGAYVILTSSSNVVAYESFGDVATVSSWNTLTNSGEQLILLDNLGNQVDSLTYDLTWYQDDNKSDGGWSLEQVNPELVCSDSNNWTASTSIQGGTPGTQNSVYDSSPDVTGPSITNVAINSDQELVVTFNEIIDEGSIAEANFSLSGGVNVSNASPNLPYGRSITLALNPAMTSGTIYELTITGLADCAGNDLVRNSIQFLFDDEAPVFQRLVFKTPDQIDIIFDEVVNESLAETESNFSINQGIGNPGRNTLNPTVRNRISLELASELTEGSVYTLSYQNLSDTLGNTISLSAENFDFQNQIDTIIVISSQLLDIYFDEDLNEASAEIVTNYVADDGLGSPLSAALDGTNPRLVHLVFNGTFPENSTTEIQFENIQDRSLNYLQLFNTNFTYDTDDPDVDSVVVVDENTLRVYFDEILDQTSAETVNNYSANKSIGTPTQAILQSDQTSVVLNFSVDFEQEVENTVTLTAIEDLSGNTISTNRNYDFIYDKLAPRLVGVKMLTPTVLAIEFSEEVAQVIAENVNNYSVDNGIGNPIQAIRTERNTHIVELTFADLGNNAVNTLTISNATDLFDNSLIADLTATFSSQLPELGKFIITSDTSLQVQFTKSLTQASAEEIKNYSFDSGIGAFSLAQNDSDASIINILLTTRFVEGKSYRMEVNHLDDEYGNTLEPITHDFTFSDLIAQVSLINANTLEIDFEVDLNEALAETASNYLLDGGIGSPLTAVLNGTDPSLVTLFFDQALTESETYELVVQNLLDIYGDVVPRSRNTIHYDVTAPTIKAVHSTYKNEIEVVFDEPVDLSTATSLNHYSLNFGVGQPTEIRLSTDATSAVLTFSDDLINAATYTLTVDRVEDLQGKAIGMATYVFTYVSPISPAFRDLVINEVYFDNLPSAGIPNYEFIEIYNQGADAIELRDFAITDKRDTAYLSSFVLQPNDYITLSSHSARFEFRDYGNAMGLTNFPSLANDGETIVFIDRDLNILDSLQYTKAHYNDETKENGGFSVELINPAKPCYDVANYAASTNANGGTPGTQNSVHDSSPDLIAPSLNSLEVLSTTQLRLYFSEAMDVSSLIAKNFATSGTETVSSVTFNDPFGTDITLTLSAAFTRGTSQTLKIGNLSDCAGNSLSTTSDFAIGDIPEANELLITEIMASPTPSNGLPEREYIELYNNSSEILSLSGLKLTDNNSFTTLDAYELNPGEYLILTSTSAAGLFEPYGNVLAVTSFPTLSADDIMTLKTAANALLFSVDFDNSFYNDDKDNGGYSLEMINLNPSCYDNDNWTASNSLTGGTPGAQNSVFDNSPDLTAPSVSSFTVVSSTILDIEFSESMNVATFVSDNFGFSGSLSIASINSTTPFGRKIRITLSSEFTSGLHYSLTLTNLSDCAGNALAVTQLEFSRGASPSPGELIITEIMAAPSPSQGLPEVEYLEVLNVSSQILDLNGIILADATTSTVLTSMIIEPGEYVILAPSSAASQLNSYRKVLPVSNWPSLNNNGDHSALFTSNSLEIHSVNYSDSWYRSNGRAEGGYSLEMIDPDYPCLEASNWIASDNNEGGTPGALNSADGSNPDLSGPTITQAIAVTDAIVEITFSEKLDATSIAVGNFSSDNGLTFISAQLDETKRVVTLSTATDLEANTLYSITADNITDCTGNLIQSSGKTVELIISGTASPKDILVNEILFNPVSGGDRFVEFYNNSAKYINLKGWKIAGPTNTRVITEENLFIHPNTYFVITSDGAKIKSLYPKAVESTFIEIGSMPSLASDEGTVSIQSLNNTEIDKFEYSEDYHSLLIDDPNGVSLERILFSGESNDANNWFSASTTEGGATPGYANSQSREPDSQPGTVRIEPPTFAPDMAGASKFTTVNYSFDNPGNTLNISIVDAEGRLVKRLSQNSIVGTEGFFTWDGSTEDGAKAKVGYYMIILEIISSEGKISYIRDKVAIASRF